MSTTFIKKVISHVPRGSVGLAVLTGISYIAGLFRDRILAQTFGAGEVLDAYNAAFLLPDFLFNVLVASGISAAVVPIVHDLMRKGEKEVGAYMSAVLTTAVLVMAAVACGVIIFANQLIILIAPGFSPDTRVMAASMMRVLAFSPLFFAASNALGAFLVARQRYIWYGISPIVYNAGIIFGALVLTPTFGHRGIVYGALIGAALHLLARVVDIARVGLDLRASFNVRTKEFFETLRLMGPKMIGHPVEMATFWGFTSIASSLTVGSIVVLNLARNFQSVPVSMIGLVIGTSSFALLAREASQQNWKSFRTHLTNVIAMVVSLSIVAAGLLYLIREPLIGLLLGGKAFDVNAVTRVATLLGIMALAIPSESLNHVLARAWYSTKNTWVPVIMSVIALVISVGGAGMSVGYLGLDAIGWWFVAGSMTKTLGMALLLPSRLAKLSQRQ